MSEPYKIAESVRVERVRSERQRVQYWDGEEETPRKEPDVTLTYYASRGREEVSYILSGKRRIPVWAAEAILRAFPNARIPEHRIRPN